MEGAVEGEFGGEDLDGGDLSRVRGRGTGRLVSVRSMEEIETHSRVVRFVDASNWMIGSSMVVGPVTNSSPPCVRSHQFSTTKTISCNHCKVTRDVDDREESIRGDGVLNRRELSRRKDPWAACPPKSSIEQDGRIRCDLSSLSVKWGTRWRDGTHSGVKLGSETTRMFPVRLPIEGNVRIVDEVVTQLELIGIYLRQVGICSFPSSKSRSPRSKKR